MTTLKASSFQTREELEGKILTLVGLTPELKPDYQIKGTTEELAALWLSSRTVFYGVRCVSTDDPPLLKVNKESRGDVKDFGLNGNTKKKPVK